MLECFPDIFFMLFILSWPLFSPPLLGTDPPHFLLSTTATHLYCLFPPCPSPHFVKLWSPPHLFLLIFHPPALRRPLGLCPSSVTNPFSLSGSRSVSLCLSPSLSVSLCHLCQSLSVSVSPLMLSLPFSLRRISLHSHCVCNACVMARSE